MGDSDTDTDTDTDTDIDEPLVRRLLREQHPDLAGLPLRPVAGGWDHRLWRLGEELAVRLPRNRRAGSVVRNERRWLPVLAPQLPLPVPTPVRAGEPSAAFPRPWNIVTWVPGEPGDRVPAGRGGHAADRLADFLGALHVKAPADAPANPHRGALASRADEFERHLDAVADRVDVDGVRAVWEEAVAAPEWTAPPVWLHGDLHPANVVVAAGTLAGVIDFGDVCAGDPATDLAAAWLLLPAGAAWRFFATYAEADPATVGRARGWAVLRGLSLVDIGRAGEQGLPGGRPTWGPAGRAALQRVLAWS
ncbi:aminoglycoside phosphotransferase family protein [Streptomyces sp. NPDC001544]|uniref:aminoglycoside phosphotransferase family protein n=1 Tax=Streptomyces sp. NPDC001544 TaxID=3364584 RepID=UPI003686D1A9